MFKYFALKFSASVAEGKRIKNCMDFIYFTDSPSGMKTKKSQKIKGSDFRAWDKYDAEEECNKVDDPEYVSTKKKVSYDEIYWII